MTVGRECVYGGLGEVHQQVMCGQEPYIAGFPSVYLLHLEKGESIGGHPPCLWVWVVESRGGHPSSQARVLWAWFPQLHSTRAFRSPADGATSLAAKCTLLVSSKVNSRCPAVFSAPYMGTRT